MSIAWAWAGLAEITPWLLRFTVAGTLVTAFAHVLGSTLLRRVAIARVDTWRATVVALLLIPALAVALPGRWALPGRILILTPLARELSPAAPPPMAAVSEGDEVQLMESEIAPSVGLMVPLGKDASAAHVQAGAASLSPARGTAVPPAAMTRPFAREVGSAAGDELSLSRAAGRLDRSGAIALLWLAVAGWFLAQLLAGIVALDLHARRAKNVTWEVLHLLPAAAKRRSRHVQVLRGGPFRVPVCWGVLSPRILLPFGSGGWTRERVKAVLLHESAHVERQDGLFLILARIACALHWLNPLAWALLRRLSVDAEAACDSAVLRAGIPARDYARVLVDVATEARRSRRPDAAMALALLRTGTLTWRVTRILDPRSTAPVRRWITPAAVATLLVVTFAGATVTLEAEATAPLTLEPELVLDQPVRTEAAAPARFPTPKATPEELQYQEPDVLRRGAAADLVVGTTGPAPLPTLEIPAIDVRPPTLPGADVLRWIGGVATESERLSTAGLDLALLQPAAEPPPLELSSRRGPLVSGKLMELGSERPVQRASLVLLNERFEVVSGVVTDVNGAFAVRAPGPGEFYLHASALGYQETTTGVTLAQGDVAVNFPIKPTPLSVSGLVVEREAALNSNGFYHRMRTQIGRFLGPEEIATAHAVTVSDLLLGMPRLSVVPGAGGKRVLMTGVTGQCGPRIYIDGMLISPDGRELDRSVSLTSLEALEVYQSGVQVPLQWAGPTQGDSACGAIVAWTKK